MDESFCIIGPFSLEKESLLDTRIEGLLVSGRSLAGIATTVSFPEMDFTVDLGECTRAALRTSVIALTHGHADHIGGLSMYLAVRRLYGMRDPMIVAPAGIVESIKKFIGALGDLQGRLFEADVVAAPEPGSTINLSNDMVLGTFDVNHYPVTSPPPASGEGVRLACGYVAYRRVMHLRREYIGLPGAEIARLREAKPEIVQEELIPLVALSGDTTMEWMSCVDPHVLSARVLFQECTFMGQGRTPESALKGHHTHIDRLLESIEQAKSRAIVLYHVSQYYSSTDAEAILKGALSADLAAKVHLFDMGERL